MFKWFRFGRKKQGSARNQRAYSGAMYNRLVSDWIASWTSADAEIRGSLRALRNRSRDLARNNDFMRQFLRIVENNIVGQGIPFQAQVKMQRGGKLDEDTNSLIEAEWAKWCRKDSCHAAGLLSFQDIERLAIRSEAESGEIFVRFIFQRFGRSKVPLALEVIEADQVDDDMNGIADNGNEIRMGIERNKWGRPTAYYIKPKHPGDNSLVGADVTGNRMTTRVPAEEVIHLYRQERPGQSRGIPRIASAIMTLHHLQGYTEAEVISARASAALMGFIESPEGELRGDDVENGERVSDFQPGVFKYLAPGEKVNVPDLHRQGGQYDPFVRAMLRQVASGVGVSYESMSKDYSQSNYSSSRLALLDDRDNWRVMQQWMIENFHQVIFEKWLDLAWLSGALNLRGYEVTPEKFQNVKWQPRGWSWIDPAKEVDAYKTAVRSGFMTLTEVVTQAGGDIESLVDQRKREMDMINEADIVVDTDPKVVSNAGLTQARPAGSVLPENDASNNKPTV